MPIQRLTHRLVVKDERLAAVDGPEDEGAVDEQSEHDDAPDPD